MLKISIIKNGVVTNSAKFSTEQEANTWYDFNSSYFPEGHEKQIVSLVDQELENLRFQESDEAISLGETIIKKIRMLNRRKLKLGVWTLAQFNNLLASQVAANVERALWNGSLVTAKDLLMSMSSFYSDIEIQSIINLIDAHESKWSNLL
jgi:hypothetical protein